MSRRAIHKLTVACALGLALVGLAGHHEHSTRPTMALKAAPTAPVKPTHEDAAQPGASAWKDPTGGDFGRRLALKAAPTGA